MKNTNVMLIAYYNKKALGVRYLETALNNINYNTYNVFYKDFNSIHPTQTTEIELSLLKSEIEKCQPLFIGLSVMSSMYLDTVYVTIEMIKDNFSIPIVCGGAYASMFPERFLDIGVEFVIRCDSENAICKLAESLNNNSDYTNIPSLCFKKGNNNIINEIEDIEDNIDEYGIPTINSIKSCFIENDTISYGDPQLDTMSYEVIASRGCPFTCSYCCCPNLRQLLPKGIKGVRTRSVKSVILELQEAKKQCKHIAFVHFYDEIFPNLPGWVDEFIVEYRKYVNLPFTIWSHPKMIDENVIKKLVKVGLVEVIMGIQSGSENIRRNIFHRYETQTDIINATKTIRECGVFWSSFDFMLQHPFETIKDLKETYFLAKQMYRPFELQLHGLNFLPGTDIVPLAINGGFLTKDEMDKIMYASMEEQFGAYWQRKATRESDLWYKMVYCLQFNLLRKMIEKFEENPQKNENKIDKAYKIGKKVAKIRYLYKKSVIVFKRIAMTKMRKIKM